MIHDPYRSHNSGLNPMMGSQNAVMTLPVCHGSHLFRLGQSTPWRTVQSPEGMNNHTVIVNNYESISMMYE